ncbi:MAG TPA: hypothetical protein VEB21_00820 [Terriglobales bacterium]|nr:hypothetical protein [Terriglobales bacterium]
MACVGRPRLFLHDLKLRTFAPVLTGVLLAALSTPGALFFCEGQGGGDQLIESVAIRDLAVRSLRPRFSFDEVGFLHRRDASLHSPGTDAECIRDRGFGREGRILSIPPLRCEIQDDREISGMVRDGLSDHTEVTQTGIETKRCRALDEDIWDHRPASIEQWARPLALVAT